MGEEYVTKKELDEEIRWLYRTIYKVVGVVWILSILGFGAILLI